MGQKFNSLEATEHLGQNNLGKSIYRFLCDCGGSVDLVGASVKSGNTKTCGCKWATTHITHGLHEHPLYQKYHDMKSRCSNENNKFWKNYGGKGVRVRWGSFEEFYEWSLANGWQPGLSIDRIDPNGDYEPTNCEYVTRSENSRRMRLAQLRPNEKTVR